VGKEEEAAAKVLPGKEREQSSPPALSIEEALARQLEQFREMGRQGKAQRDQKAELVKPKQEPERKLESEQELKREPSLKTEKEIERKGHGHGFSR
jgi:hypothetical protein